MAYQKGLFRVVSAALFLTFASVANAATQETVAFLDQTTSERIFGAQLAAQGDVTQMPGVSGTATTYAGGAGATATRSPCAGARNAPTLTDATRTEVVDGIITTWERRTIARGDTVSRLRLDYRGAINEAQYNAALQRKNPQIADLNVICAGYTINLPVAPEGGERTLAEALAALQENREFATKTERLESALREDRAERDKLQTELLSVRRELSTAQSNAIGAMVTILTLAEEMRQQESVHAERLDRIMESNKVYTNKAIKLEEQLETERSKTAELLQANEQIAQVNERLAQSYQDTKIAAQVGELAGGVFLLIALGGIYGMLKVRRQQKSLKRSHEVACQAADNARQLVHTLEIDKQTLLEENFKRAAVSLLVRIPEENTALRDVWGPVAAFAKMRIAPGGKEMIAADMPCGARPKAVQKNVLEHLESCQDCPEGRRSTFGAKLAATSTGS